MTIKKKFFLNIFFILLFVVLAPVIIFYALGNTLESGWNILATGGIYIQSMESGSTLFVNDKIKENISFFNRDYLLKRLRPGTYTILVKKDGYNDWIKTVNVYANKVSESRVFSLPSKIETVEIKKYLEGVNSSTSTKSAPLLNKDYANILSLFNSDFTLDSDSVILSTKISTSTILGSKDNPIKSRRFSLWSDNNQIFIGWDGVLDSSPRVFCYDQDEEIICQKELLVYTLDSAVNNLDFFPGETDVVIVAVKNNIYAVEIDSNKTKKLQLLYSGEKPDFRIFKNILYVKDQDFLGKIEI